MKDIICQNHITYQNDIQHSYMVIKLSPEQRIIDYQIRMMQENPAKQWLPLHKKQMDHEIFFFYDITSKITLNQLLSRRKISKHELLSILKGLIAGLKLGEEYLLQGGSFFLHSDYIYVNPATLELSIAYLPIEVDLDAKHAVREFLIDIIVYKVSFEAPNHGNFIYELLSLLKSENFSLSQLDKMLDHLALQRDSSSMESVTKEIIPKINVQSTMIDSESRESMQYNETLIFVLVQMLLAALAALAIRYFYLQTQSFDLSSIAGIACIITAIDILVIKKLKLFQRNKAHSRIPGKNKKEFNYLQNEKRKRKKDEKQLKLHQSAIEEYAIAQVPTPYIDPRALETKLLQVNSSNSPYLQSLSEGSNEKIFIDKPSFIIGRIKSQADYISKNNAVGKLHAEIVNKQGLYYIKDLNSRNGTYINGERMIGNVEYPLQNDDKVFFADSEFRFVRC